MYDKFYVYFDFRSDPGTSSNTTMEGSVVEKIQVSDDEEHQEDPSDYREGGSSLFIRTTWLVGIDHEDYLEILNKNFPKC